MLVNGHNLEIASHCASVPDKKGRLVNHLQLTGAGTVATNGYYSVAVSALEKDEDFGSPVFISKASAQGFGATLGNESGELKVGISEVILKSQGKSYRSDLVKGKFPDLTNFKENEPALEMCIDVRYLLAIAQSLSNFQGDVARIRFFGPTDPIRFDSRNVTTGQKWEALLMGMKPGYYKDRFADDEETEPAKPIPVEDEFSRAMAEAAKLMGV